MHRLCKSCGNTTPPKTRECNQCRYQRRVAEDPVKMSFYRLKGSAKRRGHFFDLTLEQFRNFCRKTDYINKKGIYAESYHIDRIDESLGYTITNIQLLKNVENIQKYRKWVENDESGNPIFTTITVQSIPIEIDEDCPF